MTRIPTHDLTRELLETRIREHGLNGAAVAQTLRLVRDHKISVRTAMGWLALVEIAPSDPEHPGVER